MQNSKLFSGRGAVETISGGPLFSMEQMMRLTSLFNCPDELAAVTIDLNALQNKDGDWAEELAEFYLNPAERRKFKSFNFAKRKFQWLAGRICAKEAIQALWLKGSDHQADWQNLRISNTPAGRPFLETTTPTRRIVPDISITHSGQKAAALASLRRLCGLDLQEISSTVIRVKSRFASPAELSLLLKTESGWPERTLLTMLWAGKEAVRKAFPCQPLPGFMDLRLHKFSGGPHEFSGQFICQRLDMPPTIPFYCFLYKNYAGALTIVN